MNILPLQPNSSLRHRIKTGNQIYQRGFAGARTADNADGLSPLHPKMHILQSLISRPLIGQGYMVKLQIGGRILHRISHRLSGLFCRRLCRCIAPLCRLSCRDLQHPCHPVRAGQRLGNGDNQIGQLYQFHQNLGHVIDNGHHLALGQVTHVDLKGPGVNQRNDGSVDNHISEGIHNRADPRHRRLQMGKRIILLPEPVFLHLLLVERTDHTHTGEVFSGNAKHPVQGALYLLVHGHGDHHYAENHHGQQRNSHHKDQRTLYVNGKSHDHGAKHNKRRAQEQAQHHVYTVLHLIDIRGHTGNHGGRSQSIYLCKGKTLNVLKERMFETGGESHRRLGRKILGCDGTDQPDQTQGDQQKSHLQDIRYFSPLNTRIDDGSHHQRHKQLKGSLQHLKKRGADCLLLILFQINQKLSHNNFLLYQNLVYKIQVSDPHSVKRNATAVFRETAVVYDILYIGYNPFSIVYNSPSVPQSYH